mmetsp:Transcript_2113/g.6026  ORF Transcript_2113/g.6026 Transcript_2113/m.6026 type:complete len:223 (+) Transcript_2113:380-1048(+)
MVVPHVIVTYHLNLFSTSLEGMQSRIEPVPVVAVVKRHAHQHPKLFPSSDQCQRRARGGRALRLCDALMGIHDVRRVVVVLLLLGLGGDLGRRLSLRRGLQLGSLLFLLLIFFLLFLVLVVVLLLVLRLRLRLRNAAARVRLLLGLEPSVASAAACQCFLLVLWRPAADIARLALLLGRSAAAAIRARAGAETLRLRCTTAACNVFLILRCLTVDVAWLLVL